MKQKLIDFVRALFGKLNTKNKEREKKLYTNKEGKSNKGRKGTKIEKSKKF